MTAVYETVGLASSSSSEENSHEEEEEQSFENDTDDFVDNDSIPEEFVEEESSIHRRTCLLRVVFFMMVQAMVAGLALLFILQPTNTLIPFQTSNQGDEHVQSSAGHSQEYEKLKRAATVENVENGAVASDHALCSDTGVKILRDYGGNAVDAAVATALCLGVVNPASSGIGGGAFILIHADMTSHQEKIRDDNYVSPNFIDARDAEDVADSANKDKVTEVIDCRETAPAAANTHMFQGKPKKASIQGGLSIAVPGSLKGLELAHKRHGLLPWAVVVEPALNFARGVTVGKHLASDIPKYWNTTDGLKSILTRHNDKKTMLEEGDTMTQPAMAKTLEAIMQKGANAIYSGYQASQLARDIQKAGGIITIHDLHNYKPTLRTPLIAKDVHGFTMVGAPPPSSGGAAIIGAARFLVGYKERKSQFGTVLSKHRMVEAMRHVFAIRMSLSDPLYNKNTTAAAVRALVHGKHMEALRSFTLDEITLPLSRYGGKFSQLRNNQGGSKIADSKKKDDRWLENHGTSHLSVVDKDGNAVSISSSLNTVFGSRVVSESTGIFLNNQMDDFAIPGRPNYHGVQPSEANYVQPRKKPLSSMSPMLVFRHEKQPSNDLGTFFLAVGASGGPKIITSVLQTFLNYARGGMHLFDAVTFPRLHDQLLYHESATTLYERTNVSDVDYRLEVPEVIKKGLKTRGHRIGAVGYTGSVQAVAVDRRTGKLVAVSDVRKGGKPSGY